MIIGAIAVIYVSAFFIAMAILGWGDYKRTPKVYKNPNPRLEAERDEAIARLADAEIKIALLQNAYNACLQKQLNKQC